VKYYVEEIITYKRGAFIEADSPEDAEDAFIDYVMNPDTDLDIYGDNSEIFVEEAKKDCDYDVVVNKKTD